MPGNHVQDTLDSVVQLFESGDVPATIARVTYPHANTPSARWSLSNRLLLAIHGTADARGFRQWKDAGRQVQKGARAVWILAPRMVNKKETTKAADGSETTESHSIIAGFVGVPVFRAEDTAGEALDYEATPVPVHPLADVAGRWGLTIRTAPGNDGAYGWYSGERREITLCTPEESTFFHELAHAADDRLGTIKRVCGQDPGNEIVAQLSSAVLARLVGRQPVNDGYSFAYISSYARQLYPKAQPRAAVAKACLKLVSRVGAVLQTIIAQANAPSQLAQAA